MTYAYIQMTEAQTYFHNYTHYIVFFFFLTKYKQELNWNAKREPASKFTSAVSVLEKKKKNMKHKPAYKGKPAGCHDSEILIQEYKL